MEISHHYALLIGYGVALGGWLIIAKLNVKLWPRRETIAFSHPWYEIGWAILALIGILAIGQLYQRGWMIPTSGSLAPLLDALNQILIFSPLILLFIFRIKSFQDIWLQSDRVWLRLIIGLGLALVAILAFTVVRTGSSNWFEVVPRVYNPKNISYLVQVFLEDVAIAIMFIRFRAAIGLRLTIILVAILFAAGHIPALLAGGASAGELVGLIFDAGLVVAVLWFIQRSADIWWIWCVHFAMDMMQFYAVD